MKFHYQAQEITLLTLKAPNTTKAEFANTIDPDETAHNELSPPDLQCSPSNVCFLDSDNGISRVFPMSFNFWQNIFFAEYGA